MLQDIEDCKDDVSYVLVFKLSRFGRNAADVLNSLQLMQDFGVNLICVEDGINSAKESGKLMISILSAVAELERENILVKLWKEEDKKPEKASELKTERESYRKSLQQCIGAKNKLAAQIDALDIMDKHYDRKYQDMQDRLDSLYEQMGDIEEKIETVNKRIDNLLKERLSADTIYKVLIQFDKLYDSFTDLEKKKFMQSFIEEVQIYEQPKENGRFLKSISFAFPVYYEDSKSVQK